MARHFELHVLSHSIAFSMNSNFSLVIQIGLAVPFCLQFWYSFDKLQRGEILQGQFPNLQSYKSCIIGYALYYLWWKVTFPGKIIISFDHTVNLEVVLETRL